jgi:carboxyl-terminal processing protease
MKQKLLSVLLVLALAGSTQAAAPVSTTPPVLTPLESQAQTANVTAQILTRYHYKTMPLDDAMSEKIFDRYLKSLDPGRLFLLQTDIDQFTPARTKLDDAINNGDLRIPFAMFNLYEARYYERMAFARKLLVQGFDFAQDESYQFDRSKEAWAKGEAELNDVWRKRVKNDWLRLKLAGKDDKSIRETLAKRYETSLARAARIKSDDVFQIFLESYANAIEPHTDYLGPRDSANFGIAMKLSLVGIGAVLQERDDYTTIRELSPGGPAIRSEKLKVGDRIVSVAQGSAALVDVVGWRLDDVVALIRGAKASTVRLEILPADAGPDAKTKIVSLVRDQIRLEQQAAKKSIITVKDGAASHQVGVIALPTFYMDFDARSRGDNNYNSATRDVAKLLEELKKEKIDNVVIDLRNNGGGSLAEAIELSGLFIGKGPVVQQKDAQGKIRIESDTSNVPVWTGTVGVLINRGSASASEIFAAAIQDYGRGLIIGEPSFGKGTVQTMLNLDQMAHIEKPKFGELKMTVAQFFRINGGTTQLRGVTPDISLPTMTDPTTFGESSYDNALPWVQIPAADYRMLGDVKAVLPQLQIRHESRIAKDRDFQFLNEDIAEITAQRKKNMVSLNEVERRKELDTREARTKKRKAQQIVPGSDEGQDDDAPGGKDDGLQAGERSLAVELAAEKSRKNAKDILLNEAAHILSDEVEFLKTDAKLAARVMSGMKPSIAERLAR